MLAVSRLGDSGGDTHTRGPEGTGLNDQPLLAPGAFITDRLVVERRIGAGGLGEVYEVTHKFTRHRRAVKVLHTLFRRDQDVVARFLNEASAAGRIGNPHIVETFDAGLLDDGSPYLVMEFLDGKPVREVLRAQGRLEPGLAAAMMVQVCAAVQAAHDAGVIHRDLKPDNLFLTERDGRAFLKVLDFGISKFQVDGAEKALKDATRTGITMGTPRYMAPEQLKSARNADGRSDVYSLGVILYELLSGEAPFDAESFVELALRIIAGEHRSLQLVDVAIPRALSAIVEKAMCASPDERFQSAQALGAALEPFARNQSVRELLATRAVFAQPEPERASEPEVDAAKMATPPPRGAPLSSGQRRAGAGLGPTAFGAGIMGSSPEVPAGSRSSSAAAEQAAPLASRSPAGPRPRALLAGGLAALAFIALIALGLVSVLSSRTKVASETHADSPAQLPALTAALAPVRLPQPVNEPPPSLMPVAIAEPPPAAAESAARPLSPAAKRSPGAESTPRRVEPLAPPPKARGVVDIACRPVQCAVILDGAPLGETPILNRSLSVGSHTAVLVNLETRASQTRQLEVKAGERTKLVVPF